MADFFLWLFCERKFSPITIKGYKTRLSSAFWQLSLWDVGSHHDIFDAGSLFQEHPVTHSLFPHETWPWSWPRSLCCWCHFRVMENAVFLLALATEARVSELCALSISPDFLQFRDDGFGWLMMDPAFLMKNQLPLVPQQPLWSESCQSLEGWSCSPAGHSLCSQAQLFLPLRADHGKVSFWIKDAYVNLLLQASWLLYVHSHNMQAIASSFAFHRNVTLLNVMFTFSLHFDSNFSWFYLRDFSIHSAPLALWRLILMAQQAIIWLSQAGCFYLPLPDLDSPKFMSSGTVKQEIKLWE